MRLRGPSVSCHADIDRQTAARQRAGIIESIRRTPAKAGLLAVMAACMLSCKGRSEEAGGEMPVLSGGVASALQTAIESSPEKKRLPESELDWKRTHVLVFNGSPDEKHLKNAIRAIRASLKNTPAGIYAAGLGAQRINGAKQFGEDSEKISAAAIEAMLSEVRNSSSKGDTALIYITSHKPRDMFGSRGGDTLDHTFLPARIREHLAGRRIIVVSDSPVCSCFVSEIARDGETPVTLISASPADKSAPCDLFMKPFWYGIGNRLDADGDGLATLKESYAYASKGHQRFYKAAIGGFRQPVTWIKKKDEAKDGVVMATADWCPACKKMEPVFRMANRQIEGSLGFYLIDSEDAGGLGSLPTIIIRRDGKKAAATSGAMEFGDFVGWLKKNGGMAIDIDMKLQPFYQDDAI